MERAADIMKQAHERMIERLRELESQPSEPRRIQRELRVPPYVKA